VRSLIPGLRQIVVSRCADEMPLAVNRIIDNVSEIIREATVEDAWAIATVHVCSWQAVYRGLLPDEMLDGLSVADRQRRWAEVLSQSVPRRATLVFCREERVLGFASVGPQRADGADPEAGELYAIYLDPGHWRRGLGARLYAAALERLRSDGFGHAVLWVLVGNERAIGFYRQAGWTPDGGQQTETGPDEVPLNEIRFRLTL